MSTLYVAEFAIFGHGIMVVLLLEYVVGNKVKSVGLMSVICPEEHPHNL